MLELKWTNFLSRFSLSLSVKATVTFPELLQVMQVYQKFPKEEPYKMAKDIFCFRFKNH